MPTRKHTARLALALAIAAPGLAQAGEVTLPFRLVTQDVDVTSLETPDGATHTVSLSRSVGSAVFEDGRIAHKSFVVLGDDGEESGKFNGYSIYVFENGDSLTLSFTGGWSSERVGGDYTVLSGTGAFEGATGTGYFNAADADWDGASLWNGKFVLDMPGS